jgi:hypothetical protein
MYVHQPSMLLEIPQLSFVYLYLWSYNPIALSQLIDPYFVAS